ncbi:MAG: hypothetical protein ACR2GY_14435 [Phycisphaerales bacterium]
MNMQMIERMAENNRRQVQLENRIRQLNRRYIDRLAALLPLPIVWDVWRSYVSTTYPNPGLRDQGEYLATVLGETLERDDLTDEEREVVRLLYAEYVQRIRAVVRELEQAYDDVYIDIAITNFGHVDTMNQYKAKIEAGIQTCNEIRKSIHDRLIMIMGEERMSTSNAYRMYRSIIRKRD